MKKITKNTTIGEALKINKHAKEILTGFGMHCFACPMSQMETLEEASTVHGIDLNLMIEKLNEQAPVAVNKKIKVSSSSISLGLLCLAKSPAKIAGWSVFTLPSSISS